MINRALHQVDHLFTDESAGMAASMLSSSGVIDADGKARRLSQAEAFVLTWSLVGVVHASASANESELPNREIDDALLQLIQRFVL